jgi:uncharacterized protein (DUF2267 family)
LTGSGKSRKGKTMTTETTKVKITIDGATPQEVSHMVAREFADQLGYSECEDEEEYGPNRLHKKVAEMVANVVRERIDPRLEELVDARLEKVVDTIFAEGWQRTDEWGHEKGPRLTVEKRVDAALSYAPKPDNFHYNRRERTPLEKAVDKVLGDEIPKMVREETEKVQKLMRKAIDKQLSGSVVKSLRDALGLRG